MADLSRLPAGPFTRGAARAAGVTDRMLQGRGFVRIYPRVWRRADFVMTPVAWRTAAALALPESAQLTGISRLQAAGLDYGPALPVMFVVQGPLHLAFENVFLHRTKLMPPTDDVGVVPEAAYISYCSLARTIDAIKVGDWLLHRSLLDLAVLCSLAEAALWRPGAHEALWVSHHLDGRCRSVKESELKSVLTFAGLPVPEVNVEMEVAPDATVEGDLWYPEFETLVEYEGEHHQSDRAQYRRDIDRYALVRDQQIPYVQITHEHLASPRIAVGRVHRMLLRRGYDGPPPKFEDQWRLLFAPLSVAVGPRTWPRRAA